MTEDKKLKLFHTQLNDMPYGDLHVRAKTKEEAIEYLVKYIRQFVNCHEEIAHDEDDEEMIRIYDSLEEGMVDEGH